MYEKYKTAQKKFWHPMSSSAPAHRAKTLIIARGDGNYITDIDGQRMLDGVGGLWNVNIGHNRASVKAAIAAQLDELAYYQTLVRNSHDLQQQSANVADEIAQVLVALQFQDRVSQMLTLITRDLDKLQQQLDERQASSLSGHTLSPMVSDRWLQELSTAYTMPEQHAIHGGNTHAKSDDSEITFF